MLEGEITPARMHSASRFFLFCFASWTTFNYAVFFQYYFIAWIWRPLYWPDDSEWFQDMALNWFGEVYFFSNWDFLGEIFVNLDILGVAMLFAYLVICLPIPVYLWLRKQTLGTAFWLAISGAFAGPSAPIFIYPTGAWVYGVFGVVVSYFALKILSALRDRFLPNLRLPAWLEWRRQWINWKPYIHAIAKYKNPQ